MTAIEVTYSYAEHPPLMPAQIRALSGAFAVYGVRAVQVDEKERRLTVEFDATRLSEDDVANIVRRSGIALVDKIVPAVTDRM